MRKKQQLSLTIIPDDLNLKPHPSPISLQCMRWALSGRKRRYEVELWVLDFSSKMIIHQTSLDCFLSLLINAHTCWMLLRCACSITHIDHDCLGLSKGPQGSRATFTPDATLLAPSEWGVEHEHADTIYADHSRINIRGNPKSSVDVLSEYPGHQTIFRVTTAVHHLFFSFEGMDHSDRTKYFLCADFGVVSWVDKHRGLEEISL